jgi:DNA-binding NarL/FixJ family response regulator|tara:strand:- start:320 stop:547 length:228 start_codon:yes stop_codon:yes gene_type:complete
MSAKFLRAIRAQDDVHKRFEKPKVYEKRQPLTEAEVERVARLYREGVTQAEIARAVKIAPSSVYNVVRRHLRQLE